MSKLQQIQTKVNQTIDIDKSFGSQCFDWSVYCARIISDNNSFYPSCQATGGVADWAIDQSSKQPWLDAGWQWVLNDYTNPNQVPEVGSIFVESANWSNPWGHTGVITEVFPNEDRIITMEQNIGSGDGEGYDDRVQTRDRQYNGIVGWFTYPTREKDILPILEALPKQFSNDYYKNAYNSGDKDWLLNSLNDRDTEVTKLKSEIDNLNNQIKELSKSTLSVDEESSKWYNKTLEQEKIIKNLREESLSKDKAVQGANNKVADLNTIVELKEDKTVLETKYEAKIIEGNPLYKKVNSNVLNSKTVQSQIATIAGSIILFFNQFGLNLSGIVNTTQNQVLLIGVTCIIGLSLFAIYRKYKDSKIIKDNLPILLEATPKVIEFLNLKK